MSSAIVGIAYRLGWIAGKLAAHKLRLLVAAAVLIVAALWVFFIVRLLGLVGVSID